MQVLITRGEWPETRHLSRSGLIARPNILRGSYRQVLIQLRTAGARTRQRLLCRVSDAGPSLARPRVLGLALESLQGKNPRDIWLRTRSKRYGDFGVAVVMGKPRRPLCVRMSDS